MSIEDIENLNNAEAFAIYVKLQKRFEPKKYRFQNRSINEAKKMNGQRLCIIGAQKSANGGGVLEWCADESEAERLLTEMQKDPDFENLEIGWA